MLKKEIYIITFDLKLNSLGNTFPDNVYAIIEELRLDYFKNESLKISDKAILIATEEDILNGYPNISSWIEDITISLTDKSKFISEDFEEVQWFIFTPDENKIEKLKDQSLEVRLFFEYLDNRNSAVI